MSLSRNADEGLYRVVKSDDLAHDTIDGETVIMDMRRGVYFRLEGAAALAWENLVTGVSPSALAEVIGRHHAAAPGEIGAALDAFLPALLADGLIERAAADAVAGRSVPPIAAAAPLPAFAGLHIHRFNDLDELLWVDPIHEVDETGWPAVPPKP